MEQLECDLRDHLISSMQDKPDLDLEGLMKIGSGFMANDMLSGGYAQRIAAKAPDMRASLPQDTAQPAEDVDGSTGEAAESAEADTADKIPENQNIKGVSGAPNAMPDKKRVDSGQVDPEYFVIHSTVGGLSRKTIEGMKGKQGKAHAYIMNNGDMINIVPFDQKAWATKSEKQNRSLIGKMYHIELNYPGGGSPSEEMYNKLAETYKMLNEIAINKGHTLTIVPHREVDRGISNGHFDPENFDFNHFYEVLKAKGVDVDKINKITQERYLIPNMADHKSNWPPVLSGPAERK